MFHRIAKALQMFRDQKIWQKNLSYIDPFYNCGVPISLHDFEKLLINAKKQMALFKIVPIKLDYD